MRDHFSLLGSPGAPFVGPAADVAPTLRATAPAGGRRSLKERSARMLTLLFVLTLTLHLGGALWLAHPAQAPLPAAKPMEMQVSMVKVARPKPVVPPPPPAPASLKPPPRKKPQPRPKLAMPPVVQTPSEFAPTEQAINLAPPLPAVMPSENPAPSKSDATPIAEPDFRAHYARNPAPIYPTMAQSRGWQGKVLLRVLVSTAGIAETVAVEQSSGHDMLDESALEAVKKWQFTPAMQGETPLTSTVLVPIIFTLRD